MKKTFSDVSQVNPVKPRGILKEVKEGGSSVAPKSRKLPLGRPPKKAENRLTEKITLNLTAAEKAALQEKAGNVAVALFVRLELKKIGLL